MPRGTPGLRLHKPSGRAVVTLDGKDHYVGKWDTPEAKERYHRLVAEWLEGKRTGAESRAADQAKGLTGNQTPTLTVAALILAFWKHAEVHYRSQDGTPTGELENFRHSLRPLRKLYGMTPAAAFGPKALRSVQGEMVRSGLARTTINARINRIRQVYRWGVSQEMIPMDVLGALKTVEPLKRGRTEAREAEPVQPVARAIVEATLPHLSRPLAAMVQLQLLTGCRPGEVMTMRPIDIVRGVPNWTYEPGKHKSAWRGKPRVVPLGPRARAILEEFATLSTTAYYFRPTDSIAENDAKRAAGRKSKVYPSEVVRNATAKTSRPRRRVGDRYRRGTYHPAIWRACDKAFPHPIISAIPKSQRTPEQAAELESWRKDHRWHPNQLRHLVASEVRAEFGLEASQTVLGHARADTTQIYAQRDLTRAHDVASKRG